MMVPSERETYYVLCKLLERSKPFTFSRYGDGEWNVIFGKKGHNGDKHIYYPDMGEALKEIVTGDRDGNYMYGLQPLSKEMYGDRIKGVVNNDIVWWNADCLHQASIDDNIDRYFDAIRNNRLIMVGPKYLRAFEGYDEFVDVPQRNCWNHRERIIDNIAHLLDEQHTVVSVVASMAANYIVDELYKRWGDRHTFIDAGSVYDPYVGIKTRRYHDEILKRLNYK